MKANSRFPKAPILNMWNRLGVQKPSGPFMNFTNSVDLE